ncbi:MAG: hypothetical protein HY903_15980 [Deltaproteobacteria bacterium]|nr:hypothetical protein [Deltaproteobacteria bacterium]
MSVDRSPGGLIGLVAMGVVIAAPARAAAPIELQAKLFFKIATYDENLPAEVLNVGVAYPSATAAAPIVKAFRDLENMKVNGRRIQTIDIPYKVPADIAAAATKSPIYGLFVTAAATEADVRAIRDLAKKLGAFTFAQDERHVASGLTAGVAVEGDKRIIVLNMAAAIEQGRKYDGNFLKACKIMR